MLNYNGKLLSPNACRYLEYAVERAREHSMRMSECVARVRRDGLTRAEIDDLERVTGELHSWSEHLAVFVKGLARAGNSRAW